GQHPVAPASPAVRVVHVHQLVEGGSLQQERDGHLAVGTGDGFGDRGRVAGVGGGGTGQGAEASQGHGGRCRGGCETASHRSLSPWGRRGSAGGQRGAVEHHAVAGGVGQERQRGADGDAVHAVELYGGA